MTDILDLIDAATEQRCACGCGTLLDPDGADIHAMYWRMMDD